MKNLLKYIWSLPKKYLIILTILVLGGGFFLFRSDNSEIKTLEFQEVKRSDIRLTLSASGILTGKDNVNLKFKSSGRLAYLNVKPGDKVYKGQVLAGLDTQELNIALQQAQNTLRDKQAAAQKIEDDLKDRSSDETYSQRQSRTTAQVARDNAYDDVKAAQRAFQDAVIVSPINGIVVSQSQVLSGQNITASDLIAQVVDFKSIYFESDIDESDISKVSLGQKAEVSLNAYPDKVFPGVVDQILPFTKTSSSGAITITVKVLLDDSSITPIYGLNGEVSIIESSTGNVINVPQSAVINQNQVIIKSGDKIEIRTVELGNKGDSEIEVKAGLEENSLVAVNPTNKSLEGLESKGSFANVKLRR